MDRDGSGVVHAGVGLDDGAVRQVGDFAGELRVDDMRQAGWEVAGPRREADGLTWVRASKRFSDVGEIDALVAQLNGPGGPFKDFRVSRSRSLLHTRTEFSGTIDVADGLRGISDPALDDRVGDPGLELDMDGLRRRFGDDLGRAVTVEGVVRLPGELKSNAPSRVGAALRWVAVPGQRVTMTASGETDNGPVLVVAGVAVAVAGAGVVFVGLRRRRRRRR